MPLIELLLRERLGELNAVPNLIWIVWLIQNHLCARGCSGFISVESSRMELEAGWASSGLIGYLIYESYLLNTR